MTDKPTPRPFTGWHMTAILVAFFGVVITVNLVMAHFALSTFGGTVVENSYVASQQYNASLAQAAAQDRLGWDKVAGIDPDRHVRLQFRKDGAVLEGLSIAAARSHPLGRVPARAMRFVPSDDGAWRSTDALPQGRWRLDVTVRRAADEARYQINLE